MEDGLAYERKMAGGRDPKAEVALEQGGGRAMEDGLSDEMVRVSLEEGGGNDGLPYGVEFGFFLGDGKVQVVQADRRRSKGDEVGGFLRLVCVVPFQLTAISAGG